MSGEIIRLLKIMQFSVYRGQLIYIGDDERSGRQ